MKNKTQRNIGVFAIANGVILFVLAFLMLFPFINIFFISISGPESVLNGEIILFPKDVHFEAYKIAVESTELFTAYKNTLIYTILGTFISLIVAALTAYPLARKKMPGIKIIIFLIAIFLCAQALEIFLKV